MNQKGEDVGNLKINSMVNMGICYRNLRAIDKAIAVYQRVHDLDPKEEAGMFNLAICLLNSIEEKQSERFNKVCQQRAKKAEELFNTTLSRNSNNFMAKLSLIKLKYLLDNSERSLREGI